MTRALLACLFLLTACQKDPSHTLQPKIEGSETYEIERFGPGDSPPIRLKGGDYQLAMFPADDCGEPLNVKIREFHSGDLILEATGNFVSRNMTGVKPGVYVVNAVVGNTSCPSYLSLLPD